jgi:hypothetical protein
MNRPQGTMTAIDRLPERAAIRAFVQGRLGCGCPESVFESVTLTRSAVFSEEQPYDLRLAVGGRLLVYVVRVAAVADPAAAAQGMAAAGRRERDAGGFNRFRAVLVTDAAEDLPVAALQAFARAAGDDARCHLHVVDPDASAALFA